jgi:cysteine desulfurase
MQPFYGYATTPMDPRVLEMMLPYFGEGGNAASRNHPFGGKPKRQWIPREQIAKLIGASGKPAGLLNPII